MASNRNVFENKWYQNLNEKRLDHLQSLGLDLDNKRVLEIGAGIGDLSNFWLQRGCDLTLHEAKPENIDRLSERFPNLDLITTNLNSGDLSQTISKKFEIIFCYGVLFYLQNPTKTLKIFSENCYGILLLETMVSKGAGISIHKVLNTNRSEAAGINGISTILSREILFTTLKFFSPFVYVPISQPNHEYFPNDWSNPDDKRKVFRTVFIASKRKISNEQLIEHLPMYQETHL